MKNIVILLAVIVLLISCTTLEEPIVSRYWELQGDGHYIFETNNPNNAGMISYKGWSGFHHDARSVALAYRILSGGRGLVYGLKIELSKEVILPLLVVDFKGRYNLLDPRTYRPLHEDWIESPSYDPEGSLVLGAEKGTEEWHYFINGEQIGSVPGHSSDARYGAVLFTTYKYDTGNTRSDFPKKKILVEMKVLENQ